MKALLGDLEGLREIVLKMRSTASPDDGLDRVDEAITAMEVCTRACEVSFQDLIAAIRACPMLGTGFDGGADVTPLSPEEEQGLVLTLESVREGRTVLDDEAH